MGWEEVEDKGTLRGGREGGCFRGPALEVIPKPVQLHSAADIRGLEIPLDLQFKAAASLRMKLHLAFANAGSLRRSCEIQICHSTQIPLKGEDTAAEGHCCLFCYNSKAPRGVSRSRGCFACCAGEDISSPFSKCGLEKCAV